MHFERDGEVGASFKETENPKFGITLEAKNVDLQSMHERVEQGAVGEFFVEGDEIDEGEGVHVADGGEIVESESLRLGVEIGNGEARAVKFDDADPVEHESGKIGREKILVVLVQREGRGQEVDTLPAQISGEPVDGVRDLLRGDGGGGCGGSLGNPLFDGGIIFVERGGGLRGFAEHVTTAEVSEIVGGIAQAELVRGGVRGQQVELGPLQFRIKLKESGPLVGAVVRAHLG